MAGFPYYQPQFYPAQIQQPQQQMPQVIQQNGIIWVSGESEAGLYPIAPNNAVALWDRNGKTVYMKSADATGKPSIAVYDLVKRETADGEQEPQKSYATKEDFAQVAGAIRDYSAVLDAIKADVDAIKGDMYGIAGKKKVTKKTAEVTDDE